MPTCPVGHDSESTDFCDVCGMRIDSPAQAAAPAATQPHAPVPAAGSPDGLGQSCPRCGADRPGQFCEACGYSFASGPPASGSAAAAPAQGRAAPAQVASAQAAPSQAASAQAAPSQAAPGQAGPDRSAAAPGRVATAPSYVATAPSEVVAEPGKAAAPGAAATAEWTAVVTADRAYFDSVIAASGPDAAAVQFPAYCPERRFRLFGPEMRIGRRSSSRGLEPEIDLTGPPADPGVSHLHAVLLSDEDGGWTVFDPGSANGTLVNGREMAAGSRLRLRDGDHICVGAWTMLTIRAE
jgi:FHA domain